MDIVDLNIADPVSLHQIAVEAIETSGNQIAACRAATREFGKNSQAIALKTLDVLFSGPKEPDIDEQKRDVIGQFAQVLRDFSTSFFDNVAELNLSWMEVDQAVAFYLLAKGREINPDVEDIRALKDAMQTLRGGIPDTRRELANLSVAIQGSAGGLDGLEDDIHVAIEMLSRLSGELDHGGAVLQRQIILAERLIDMILTG